MVVFVSIFCGEICSLLVRVLTSLLPGGGTFTFNVLSSPSGAWSEFGSAFMLFAGAGANLTSADGGALAFHVNSPPSGSWWGNGSAII